MAISRLATSNPGPSSNTLIYTGVRTALGSIIATNKSNDLATIRVWVVPLEQDSFPENHVYIAYNSEVAPNDSLETFRFPVLTADKVYVWSSTGDISFSLSGVDDTNIAGVELENLQSDIAFATNIALLDI